MRASLLLGSALIGGCAQIPLPEWAEDTESWSQRTTPVRVVIVPAQVAPKREFRGSPKVASGLALGAGFSVVTPGFAEALCAGAGSIGLIGICGVAVMLGGMAGQDAAGEALRPELQPTPGFTSVWPADSQRALADEFASQLRAAGAFGTESAAERHKPPAAEAADYRALAGRHDLVIEVSLDRITLLDEGVLLASPRLHITGHATMRVIRARDNFVLAEREYKFTSGRGAVSRYQQDSRILAAATAYLLTRLAELMTDDVLHGASRHIELPIVMVHPAAHRCFWGGVECEGNVIVPEIEGADADEAALLFKWRPDQPQNASGTLVYDFRLVGPEAVPTYTRDRPYPVYEHHYIRYGLHAPEHRLQVPLARCASYRWAVRARTVDGARMQVTPWTRGSWRLGEELGEPFRTKC